MQIDFSTPIFDEATKQIVVAAGLSLGDKDADMTLGTVALGALLNGDQGLQTDDKVKRFKLMGKISKATAALDLSAEDIVLLKAAIGAAHGSLATGRAVELLEA